MSILDKFLKSIKSNLFDEITEQTSDFGQSKTWKEQLKEPQDQDIQDNLIKGIKSDIKKDTQLCMQIYTNLSSATMNENEVLDHVTDLKNNLDSIKNKISQVEFSKENDRKQLITDSINDLSEIITNIQNRLNAALSFGGDMEKATLRELTLDFFNEYPEIKKGILALNNLIIEDKNHSEKKDKPDESLVDLEKRQEQKYEGTQESELELRNDPEVKALGDKVITVLDILKQYTPEITETDVQIIEKDLKDIGYNIDVDYGSQLENALTDIVESSGSKSYKDSIINYLLKELRNSYADYKDLLKEKALSGNDNTESKEDKDLVGIPEELDYAENVKTIYPTFNSKTKKVKYTYMNDESFVQNLIHMIIKYAIIPAVKMSSVKEIDSFWKTTANDIENILNTRLQSAFGQNYKEQLENMSFKDADSSIISVFDQNIIIEKDTIMKELYSLVTIFNTVYHLFYSLDKDSSLVTDSQKIIDDKQRQLKILLSLGKDAVEHPEYFLGITDDLDDSWAKVFQLCFKTLLGDSYIKKDFNVFMKGFYDIFQKYMYEKRRHPNDIPDFTQNASNVISFYLFASAYDSLYEDKTKLKIDTLLNELNKKSADHVTITREYYKKNILDPMSDFIDIYIDQLSLVQALEPQVKKITMENLLINPEDREKVDAFYDNMFLEFIKEVKAFYKKLINFIRFHYENREIVKKPRRNEKGKISEEDIDNYMVQNFMSIPLKNQLLAWQKFITEDVKTFNTKIDKIRESITNLKNIIEKI